MKHIRFGQTDLHVSEMCLGAMNFGTAVEKSTAFALLDAYVDAGGNFIDTSNNYAHWAKGGTGDESETLLGEWLQQRGRHDDLVIATKVGYDRHGVGAGLTAKQIEYWCDESLRKLGIDTIDLYYAHVDDIDTPVEETMTAFARLIEKGKVRHIAASNYHTWRLEEVRHACLQLGLPQYCAVQQRYTYLYMENGLRTPFPFNTPATEEKLLYLARHNMPLVAYSCSAGGGYNDPSRLPAGFIKGKRFDVLCDMACDKGIDPNSLQLAWMLHAWRCKDRPQIIPLFSSSRVDHLLANLRAADICLTGSEIQLLNDAAD